MSLALQPSLLSTSDDYQGRLHDFYQKVERELIVCSPFVSLGPAAHLTDFLTKARKAETVTVEVVADLSAHNLVQGATDLNALITIVRGLPHTRITHLPRLHAKVFLCDMQAAIVGSANFTDGGLSRNREYGVYLDAAPVVESIYRDITALRTLGTAVSEEQMLALQPHVGRVRDALRDDSVTAQMLTLRQDVRDTLKPQTVPATSDAAEPFILSVEDELFRLRVGGASANALFSRAILYALRQGSLTTEAINAQVAALCPDLCDDKVDRVINGVHYGKRWKHQVRSAQSTLKRQGKIVYAPSTKQWSIVESE